MAGGNLPKDRAAPIRQMTAEDQAAIRAAIANARSMEEVERLQHMLRSGNVPSKLQSLKRKHDEYEEEEDE